MPEVIYIGAGNRSLISEEIWKRIEELDYLLIVEDPTPPFPTILPCEYHESVIEENKFLKMKEQKEFKKYRKHHK